MRARVFVTLKPSVFDPQGTTVAEALHTLGYGVGEGRRQGKYFELDIDARERGRGAAAWRPRRPTSCWPIRSSRAIASRWMRARRRSMKFAVVVFPGSNCDHDAHYAAEHVLGQEAELVWHKDTSLRRRRRRHPARRVRARRLPAHRRDRALLADHAGGEALCRTPAGRCSASATASRCCSRPGCCPARCCATRSLHFRCEHVHVQGRADRHAVHRWRAARAGAADSDRARRGQLLRRARRRRRGSSETGRSSSATSTPTGERPPTANPNGSVNNIAGICNEARNVVGLMPHPERACELAVGSADGLVMFESVGQGGRRAEPFARSSR